MIIDGIDVSSLSCDNCPENDKKRCLEQKEKYKNEIFHILSFIENAENKAYINVLKTQIIYPTRCDVVLEKQLQRANAENEELDKYGDFYLGKFCDLKQALEEIREIVNELITEVPEYHSCYYKDECGDNCTPKKKGEILYCCYENVDKILNKISEVENDI